MGKKEIKEQIRNEFYKLDREDRQAVLASLLETTVNDMCFEGDSFINEISLFHRTLQQSALGLIFKTIHEATKWYTDGRNEFVVRLCKEIDLHMTEQYNTTWYKTPFI